MVAKDRDEMWPEWDDDVDDVKIENVLRAFYGDFSNGPFRWNKRCWNNIGTKVSNIDPEKVKQGKKRGGREEAPEAEDAVGESVADVIRAEVQRCFQGLSEEMANGFKMCDENFRTIFAEVKTIEHSVGKLKKRARRTREEGLGTPEIVKSNFGVGEVGDGSGPKAEKEEKGGDDAGVTNGTEEAEDVATVAEDEVGADQVDEEAAVDETEKEKDEEPTNRVSTQSSHTLNKRTRKGKKN